MSWFRGISASVEINLCCCRSLSVGQRKLTEFYISTFLFVKYLYDSRQSNKNLVSNLAPTRGRWSDQGCHVGGNLKRTKPGNIYLLKLYLNDVNGRFLVSWVSQSYSQTQSQTQGFTTVEETASTKLLKHQTSDLNQRRCQTEDQYFSNSCLGCMSDVQAGCQRDVRAWSRMDDSDHSTVKGYL